MAKKKAAEGKSKQAGKKGGKKKTEPARKPAKKAAPAAAKSTARSAARTRKPHRQMRLGMARNGANPPPMHVGGSNTFTVYGDRIGVNFPNKTVTLDATAHNWDPPTQVIPAGNNGLRITAVCPSRKTKRGATNGFDDLTVTIELGGVPETECQYDDVEYDA